METSTRDSALADLLAGIRSDDPERRTAAWQRAGQIGAVALKPLSEVCTDGQLEVRRAAQRAMWDIVRHAGHPENQKDRVAAVKELIELLNGTSSVAVRREVLWMLSEIAGEEAVSPVASLLSHADLREDARIVLDRIPGRRSLQALRRALEEAPDEFKPNLAHSLQRRGLQVPGIASRKLVPTRQTGLKTESHP